MSKKIIMTVLFGALAAASAVSAPVDSATARLKALEFLAGRQQVDNTVKSRQNLSGELELVYSAIGNGLSAPEPAAYVFSMPDGQGFVMTSANDAFPPVLGYSFDTNFDADNIPVQLKELLDAFALISSNNSTPFIESTSGGAAIEPLMSTKWNQGTPYNYYLTTPAGKSYYTGCTATAMAQIMKYHRWPEKGSGTAVPGNIFSAVDISTSVYDWDNMLDQYYIGDYEDTQAQAVGLLMRDASFALASEYSEWETSAIDGSTSYTLIRNFGYSPDLYLAFRSNYSTQAWIEALRGSLENQRPVLVSGQSGDGGGHAFVCDGIDADNYLHINWGWGGSSDGYFDMNVLSPSNLGIGAGSGSYNIGQTAVFNIHPDRENTTDRINYKTPVSIIDFTLDRENIDSDGLLNSAYINLLYLPYNTSGSDIGTGNEILVVPVVLDGENNIVDAVTDAGVSFGLPAGYYFNSNTSIFLPVSYMESLADGDHLLGLRYTYDVQNGSLTNSTPEWLEFSRGDLLNDLPFTKKEGQYYFTPSSQLKDNESFVKFVSAEPVGGLFLGNQSNQIAVTLYNDASKTITGSNPTWEAYGMLFLVPEADTVDNPENLFFDYNGIYFTCYLYQGTETTINVSVGTLEESCTAPGTYRVYVALISPDGYNFYPLQSDGAVYVEVEQEPAEAEITFTRPFELNADTYLRSNEGIWIGVTMYPKVEYDYLGYLEVRATYLGDEESDEEYVIVMSAQRENIYKGVSNHNTADVTYRLLDAPLGEYEARIFYENKDGEMVPVPGTNNLVRFTLVDNDENTDFLRLAAPPVINNGENVPLGQHEFDIVMDLTVPYGNVDLEAADLHIVFYSIDDERFQAQLFPVRQKWGGVEYTSQQLGAGETATVTFHMVSAEADGEFRSGDSFKYYISQRGIIGTSGRSKHVQAYPHHNSLMMTLAEPVSSINDIAGDSSRIELTGTELHITGIEDNATVAVCDIAGRIAMERRVEAPSCTMSLTSLQPGIYIVNVITADRTSTFKIRR